jgi:hypothetical protein
MMLRDELERISESETGRLVVDALRCKLSCRAANVREDSP